MESKIKTLLSFLFLLTCMAAFAQEPLSSSALDQIRKNNKQNKLPEYEGVKVKFQVVFNSVKVSDDDANGVVQDLLKIPGVQECNMDVNNYTLTVRTDKTNKYLTIVDIQNALLAHHLHLMTFEEILYKN